MYNVHLTAMSLTIQKKRKEVDNGFWRIRLNPYIDANLILRNETSLNLKH